MLIPTVQADAVSFLSQRAGAPPTETAGSFLFHGERDVLKLRKAIERPLADWKPRRLRHAASVHDAARLPRALGAAVRALRRGPDGRLELVADATPGDPAVIDWLLQMAHIPQDDFLAAMTWGERLDGRQMDLIADAIVARHQAERGTPPPAAAAAPAGRGAATETLRLLTLAAAKAALEAGLPQEAVLACVGATIDRLDAASDMLDRRAAAGMAQPGHGNLHLGNICLIGFDWALLDSRPPDPAAAAPDVAWDLAPLLTELEARVSREAANRLLNRYIARTGDAGIACLMPPLMSLAALRFAADLAARDVEASAGFLRLAALYTAAAPPVVVALGGLPGVGKTTLARALAPGLGVVPGAVVLRADDLRKHLLGLLPETPYAGGAEGSALQGQAMAALAGQARGVAAAGQAVVADALFLDPAERAAVAHAAAEAGVAFLGIWLDAPLPALVERLAARPFDASDSTVDTLRAANRANPGALDWLRVDATDADRALAMVRNEVAAQHHAAAGAAPASGLAAPATGPATGAGGTG